MFGKSDEEYWLAKEEEIKECLVDLAKYKFVIEQDSFKQGISDDPRCLLRRGVADALAGAKEQLPKGCNLKVVDGWRPWELQEKVARIAEEKIRKAHPDWPEERVQKQCWMMAPPQRLLTRFDKHRYGGAVDLTVVDPAGEELDMGVPFNYVTGPEARLLYYELRDDLSAEERLFRDNRRILIRAMESACFEPYLAEWWHWGYSQDLRG